MIKKSLINRLFLMEFVTQSVAIYTLYSIMFSERGGLSSFQVGFLLASFALSTIIAEIPTGAIADRFSRKWSIVLSKFLLALAMLSWLLSPTLPGYFVGIVLMGISESLSSGAMQAYLYEHLGENSREFGRYNSRLWSMMMSGWIVGSGIAAIIGPNYNVLLILSILSPLLGTLIALSLAPDAISPDRLEKDTLVKNSGAAFRYIFSSKALIYAVAGIVLMRLLVDVMIEYIPLFYRDAGASIRIIPLLFFVGNIVAVLIFWHAHTIGKYLEKFELKVGFIFLILFALSAYAGTVGAVLGIFWYLRFTRVLFIYKEGEIQHLLQNRHRATVTSIYSMLTRLLMAVSFLLIGAFASDGGVVTPIVVFSIITFVLYAAMKMRSKYL